MSPLISAQELSQLLENENLVLFDARNGAKPDSQKVKGALIINLDKDMADHPDDAAHGGRHPLPSLSNFRKTLENFGVQEDSHFVIYDDMAGANPAARLWWMLRAFGFEKVQVVNGGWEALTAANLPLTADETKVSPTSLEERNHWALPTASIEDVEIQIAENTATVIDVRDSYRYDGESEPIDLVAGHIPGAINIPYSENLENHLNFLPKEVLKKKYEMLLKTFPEEKIIHCGSGVTACHTILAMDYIGMEKPKLYVGSWSEWSRRNKPIAKNV